MLFAMFVNIISFIVSIPNYHVFELSTVDYAQTTFNFRLILLQRSENKTHLIYGERRILRCTYQTTKP